MSKKQMTLIYYYVPQDQDDPQYPNVFGIMQPKASIRLQHIYQHFPLKGTYIIRFKVMYDNTVAWLDLPNLDDKLPTFKDKIYVKASRVSWEDGNTYGHYKASNKKEVGNGSNGVSAKAIQKNQRKEVMNFDLMGDSGHGDSLL